MSVALVASGSLAGAIPTAFDLQASLLLTLQGELSASLALLLELTAELPDIQASIDVALNLALQLQLDIALPTLTLLASLSFAADAQASLALDITAPEFLLALSAGLEAQLAVSAELSAKLSLKFAAIAELELRIGGLKLAIDAALSFATLGLAAGVRAYVYTGPLENLGDDLAAYLAAGGNDGMAPTATVYGSLILTDAPTAFEAMKGILKVL